MIDVKTRALYGSAYAYFCAGQPMPWNGWAELDEETQAVLIAANGQVWRERIELFASLMMGAAPSQAQAEEQADKKINVALETVAFQMLARDREAGGFA